MHSHAWRCFEAITVQWIGGIALLFLLSGCATTDDKFLSTKGATLQLQPMPASPAGEAQMPSSQQPRPPLTVAQPSAPGSSSTGGRVISVARLASIPVAVLAVVLWPSELGDGTLRKDWSNTINPVTLEQWRSPEEFEGFWRLPQEDRERLIKASQGGLRNSNPSAPVPQPTLTSQVSSRRHPNQTCDNAMLDHLQAEKDRICNSMPGTSCSTASTSAKRLAKMPCSQIRVRIQALQNCIAIRQLIQAECFGGLPDEPHRKALGEYRNGLEQCLALEGVNCAPNHPMADR